MTRLTTRHYGGSLFLPGGSAQSANNGSNISQFSPGSGSATCAFWLCFASFSNDTNRNDIISYANSAGGGNGWVVYQNRAGSNTPPFLQMAVKGSSGLAISNPDRAWHRYVCVMDASTHTFYIYRDGVLVGNSSAGAWSGSMDATGEFQLGRSSYSGASTTANGYISNVVYDVGNAWTLAQIQADYFQGVQPNTVSFKWELNEGTGTTANAAIGGVNLTVSGGSSIFSPESPELGRNTLRNLIPSSNAISSWGGSNIASKTGGQTDPFGGTNAVLFTESTDVSPQQHYGSPANVSPQLSQSIIFSSYIKANVRAFSILRCPLSGIYVAFDLSGLTGVPVSLVGGALPTYGIVDAGNGWRRVWMQYTSISTIETPLIYPATSTGSISYTGNGSAAIYVYGAMMEIAYPGQTTPSTWLSTGSTPLTVVGVRSL